MLFREQFEKISVNGCQIPGCKHEDHDVLFIHARCHLEGHVKASYQEEDVLRIVCGKCGQFICDAAIKVAKPYKRCHVRAPLDVSYKKGSGKLEIWCNEC